MEKAADWMTLVKPIWLLALTKHAGVDTTEALIYILMHVSQVSAKLRL